MSGGRFGALDLLQDTDLVLMEGVAGSDRVVNVRFVNRTQDEVQVRLALVDADAANALAELSEEDYLEYDAPINAVDIIETTGIIVPPNHTIVVRSNSTGVNAMAYGFEEAF